MSKADNFVSISIATASSGDKTIITISADVDGIYSLDVGGSSYNVTVIYGIGRIVLSLPEGEYYANASFDDENYNSIISNATFEVLKDPDFNVAINKDIIIGDTLILNVSVKNDATGIVTFCIGENNYTSTINQGHAIIGIPNMNAGNYTVQVLYSGDEQYSARASEMVIHVKKVSLKIDNAKYGWSKSITYQAKLIDEDGKAVANKQVSFSINGKSIKSYTNDDGLAKVSVSLKIGSYAVKASSDYGSLSRNITVVSRFSGNKNINMYYFDGTKYSFKVYGNNGKLVGANQKITVKLNKKTYTLKTNKNGVASLTLSLIHI